jgi:hypothetical protein
MVAFDALLMQLDTACLLTRGSACMPQRKRLNLRFRNGLCGLGHQGVEMSLLVLEEALQRLRQIR